MKGLAVGRLVHFIEHPWMAFDINAGPPFPHLAATITRIVDEASSEVELAVIDPDRRETIYRSGVYSNEKDSGTWHWIEKA